MHKGVAESMNGLPATRRMDQSGQGVSWNFPCTSYMHRACLQDQRMMGSRFGSRPAGSDSWVYEIRRLVEVEPFDSGDPFSYPIDVEERHHVWIFLRSDQLT